VSASDRGECGKRRWSGIREAEHDEGAAKAGKKNTDLGELAERRGENWDEGIVKRE